MKIVFRVDSSTAIGTGHLIRCRTLAEELRRRDVSVQFICRDLPGNLIAILSQSGFPVTVLPRPANLEAVTDPENYAAWLGVTQEVDAAETIAALASEDWDWLIVDHYGLDRRWEVQLRPHVKRVLAIDDLANRPHDCDILLDQNESIEGEARYHGLVPEDCHLLIGCRYALLRPEYAAYRQTQPPRTGEVQRVFVFFGGTDPQNMTGRSLAALSAPEFAALSVDVVVGANYPYRAELQRQVANRPNTFLYDPRPHLADLMARADLAIGAGGTTTWERCCLGLPTIVVSVAENQVSACQALEKKGAIVYLGTAETVDAQVLRQTILQIFCQPDLASKISVQARSQVDGLGARRVTEVLKPTSESRLRLRLAEPKDVALYYDWVNESEVRRQSLQPGLIPWETHQVWFNKKLADPQCYMGILEADNLPVGQIRFDLQGEEAVIDYSLDILVRGRGWGCKLIHLGIQLLSNVTPTYLRAEVKAKNAASRAVFLRLGFTEESTPPLVLQGLQAISIFRLPFSQMQTVGSMSTCLHSC